jgi:hypothetical protein
MGEYALYKGESVKIGTCEDMYYLRFDQRHAVIAQSGNVDPVTDAPALRFRFPWPDEDAIEPGSGKFHDNGYHRSVHVPGFIAPTDVEHSNVQFVANAGYNVCLPCPESSAYNRPTGFGPFGPLALNDLPSIRVHRNGFSGSVHLVAQRLIPEVGLVPILRCGGCGTMWREVERARIEELVVCLRSEGDRRKRDNADKFWHDIAERVLAGITCRQ